MLIEVHNTLETDRLDGIFAPDFKRVAPDVSTESLDEYKSFLRHFHGLFEGFNMTIEESAVGPESGFIKWSVTGTYTGEGAGPNGTQINVRGLAHYGFRNGKLTSKFIGFNPGWFRAQLSEH